MPSFPAATHGVSAVGVVVDFGLSHRTIARLRVAVQIWQRWARSRCRSGRGGLGPGADVAAAGPVPVQMRRTLTLTAKWSPPTITALPIASRVVIENSAKGTKNPRRVAISKKEYR